MKCLRAFGRKNLFVYAAISFSPVSSPCWFFDADDTLWESAGFFQRAEDQFVSLMASLGWDEDRVRNEIRVRDMGRLPVTGYGPDPYTDTLMTILNDWVSEPPEGALSAMERIRGDLLGHPVEPFPGVPETLGLLRSRGNTLVLYTMGQREHQLCKIRRSGLSGYFKRIFVVPRKTRRALAGLLEKVGVEPANAWVVGNSPRSDINPALACGVNAILVNRPGTWMAEMEPIPDSNLLVTVTRVADIPVAMVF